MFTKLRVARVDRLCDDAVAITFDAPKEFAFQPGQSLTVRRGDERRSYSICAPLGAKPRIGVREVPGGHVSGWLVHEIRAGDEVEALPPTGRFTPDLGVAADHVFIAAGSGITPVLSIAASVLADGRSTATIIYANRRSDTVMFADEVADLKDRHPTRVTLAHVLTREAQEVELFSGRLDADRLTTLVHTLCDPERVGHWWLCGPFGLVTTAVDVLHGFGVPDGRIHRELFYVEDAPPAPFAHPERQLTGAQVDVTMDGRVTSVTVPPETTILEGAQRSRPDLPFACKSGVCGTCRARVTSGEVHLLRNFALDDNELDDGFVLTCQAVPVTAEVSVDYDA